MQVATISGSGEPSVCHVWYHAQFQPDRIRFISRRDREHSAHIRQDGRVAGGIVAIPLSGLGQTVRGVTFKGWAHELGASAKAELDAFLEHWPRARDIISTDRIVNEDTLSRLYEISVDRWVMFDEENFPESPRRILAGLGP
jgi:hypothetical protein